MTAERDATDVLAAHAYAISTRGVECRCREFGVKYRREQWTAAEHRAHVADALAAAGLLRARDDEEGGRP